MPQVHARTLSAEKTQGKKSQQAAWETVQAHRAKHWPPEQHQSSTRAVEVKNGGTSATTQVHVGCSALGERPSARIYNTWCMCNIYTKKKNVPLYLDSSPWLFHREKPQKWKRGEKMNGRFRDTCERRIGISIWEWLVHSIPHFFFFFSFLLFKISQHVHNH